MLKPAEFGCKKCGGVVTVETKLWGDHLDIRVKDGKFYDNFGKIQVQCKKCNNTTAGVSITAAK